MKQILIFAAGVALLFNLSLFAQTALDINVNDFIVCRDVENRQPVDADSTFASNIERLYCYSQLETQNFPVTVNHIWYYNDKEMAKIPLTIKADNWRTWSSKRIMNVWRGQWRIDIADTNGNVISSRKFTIE